MDQSTTKTFSRHLPEAANVWYIFRYKMLSKQIKDYLLLHPDKVFFPYRQVRLEREIPLPPQVRTKQNNRPRPNFTTKVSYVERPSVPGYIFVHASLEEALTIGKAINLNPWRRIVPCEDPESAAINVPAAHESSYHFIPDAVMQLFIRAVELDAQNFSLLDSSCIDLSKDDYVEITTGRYKGYRGHLKSVNGSNGGLVVIPLLEECPEDKFLKRKRKSKRALLHYGIPTRSSQIAILSFAPGSRRATDQLSHAAKVVDKVMEAFIAGETITGQQTNRLMGYIHRFSQLQPERPIQRLNLTMLLYRIYTILQLHTESAPLRLLLESQLLPEAEQRKSQASKRDLASAEKTYSALLARKQETDNASSIRFQALENKLRK